MSVEDDEELLREFLLESSENLNQLDRDFVALEQSPGDRPLLGAIFRAIHTIKGTCGFLGFTKLEALTHAGETLLCRLRDGVIENDAEITSVLLAMLDGVRRILSSIETSRTEGDEDHAPIIAELARMAGTRSGPQAAAPAPPSAPVVRSERSQPPVVQPALVDPSPEGAPKGATIADSSIRVDVGLLDQVMNLVGELVLARNQIMQFVAASKDPGFVKASQRLNLLTTELQEGVMKTRMQPIGSVWNKFPRVVRDLALSSGKRVNLVLDGTETELDRSIIEAIKDPLLHAVRNAVDHGVEIPARRKAAGKPETATVTLRAFHEGGQVNIEVSDDGAGLDVERIRARAVERGLLSSERAARMTEREIVQMVFHAGFSTALTVTNVSGRGVGMDVVKTNIEKIGGTVDIGSRPARGTTLRIKIPLTLAIIPALVVTCQSVSADALPVVHRFAIPQVSLLELVRLEGAQAMKGLERLHGTTVYRLRGNLLPIVFLSRTLDLRAPPSGNDVLNIVVLQADDRQFGLVVDEILDTEEIVVKPLGKELKGLHVFAGATIMGDGRVALILDVPGIAQRASVVSAARERNLTDPSSAEEESESRESLLLFRVGAGSRMAIPLARVARLEEIALDRVEKVGGREVVQYCGTILPLVSLRRELLQEARGDEGEPLQVIVCTAEGGSVGLVVEQILDVVEEAITVRSVSERDGVLGAVVVQGKVTELLDVPGILRRADRGLSLRQDAA